MNSPAQMACPERVTTRTNAVQLWKHLLGRGLAFHWEDDPRDWVDRNGVCSLTAREAKNVRRLLNEVQSLNEPACYDDALSLLKLASLTGVETVNLVPDEHASAFASCSTPREAKRLLAQLR